ncbi:hypothetical protein ACGYJ8_17830 [Sulfitobacter sp. 1A12126]|uniref:hypothetical protein n=1 Tax=Sulfitobacter sp. 1A12126 TaxID=3368591 RepID=UPI00374703A0
MTIINTGVAAATLSLLALGLAQTTPAAAEDCADAKGVSFICGTNNVEDLVTLPGDGWVIGSDLAGAGQQGYLWLFNADHSVRRIEPDEITIGSGRDDPACPGAPDWSILEPHGLAFRAEGEGGTLVAINHGGRETIKNFDIAIVAEGPQLT